MPEDLPKIHERSFPSRNNVSLRSPLRLIIGENNIIAETAIGIIVTGNNNTVGEKCQNISILQSSGCAVAGGLVNISVMNSSGITITDSNSRIINNIVYSASAGRDFLTTSGTVTLLGTDLDMVFYNAGAPGGGGSITLPSAVYDSGVNMSNRVFVIKNASSVTIELSAPTGQKIDDSSVAKTMLTLGKIRVFSNGSNWWTI